MITFSWISSDIFEIIFSCVAGSGTSAGACDEDLFMRSFEDVPKLRVSRVCLYINGGWFIGLFITYYKNIVVHRRRFIWLCDICDVCVSFTWLFQWLFRTAVWLFGHLVIMSVVIIVLYWSTSPNNIAPIAWLWWNPSLTKTEGATLCVALYQVSWIGFSTKAIFYRYFPAVSWQIIWIKSGRHSRIPTKIGRNG